MNRRDMLRLRRNRGSGEKTTVGRTIGRLWARRDPVQMPTAVVEGRDHSAALQASMVSGEVRELAYLLTPPRSRENWQGQGSLLSGC